jgi:hypothetical protein
MLRRIAALEETIAQLPRPGPLDDSEIDESKAALATLKKLPPVPTQLPAEAVQAKSKLKAFAKKVAESLAMDAAKDTVKWVLTASATALLTQCHDQINDLIQAIETWVKSIS